MPPPPIRLPAASTPMSFMVTPPSASAAMRGLGGEVDGVLVGVLAELGHVDPEDPDVVAHAMSLLCVLSADRLEAEADGLGAVVVGADRDTWPAGPSCPS